MLRMWKMCFFILPLIVIKLTITPDRGTTLTISRTSSECKVCTVTGRKRQCEASLVLRDSAPVSVELECSKRQEVFDVEISCNGNIILTDSSSPPLLNFNRKFTWNLKATAPKSLKIDFTNTGLRQINPSQECPDKHAYTLKAFRTTESIDMGKYCRTGAITDVQILRQSSFSLEIPAGQKLQSGQFSVSVGDEIKTLARISLTLPQGGSGLELLTPNYPDSFPDDDVMDWHIKVPAKHQTSVQFLNLTQPRCLYKETAMEYHGVGRAAVVVMLNQNQPVQSQGTFSMMLRNCKMDRSRAGSPGLSFAIKLSATKTTSTDPCRVDLRKTPGLSLQIEKLKSASGCEMKQISAIKDNITVLPNSETQLSFQDCLPEDIQCYKLKDCPKGNIQLSVPQLPSCLLASLTRVTWTFTFPQDGTVEFSSLTAGLRQSLPGQSCNDSIVVKLAEDDGTTIGNFCRQGAIQKVQIHTNMSVSLSCMKSGALKMLTKPLLYACIKNEISERYIFTVSPRKDTPLLLATPGWPLGMKSQSTASWIVNVPPKMDAHIMFPHLTQPKCSKRHTNIKVQALGSREEFYSRREDEEADNEITVSESFYLNMSNCMPERGDFMDLENLISRNLTKIIFAYAVCYSETFFLFLSNRKKKKKLAHQVSIYNPNGTSFLPGYNPRPSDDDDSHVYASIEDSLVYTHLLRKGAEMGIYGEHDAYRSYPGHTDSQKPLVSKDSGPDGVEVSTYQQFQQQPPSLPNRPPSHLKYLYRICVLFT
uniref:CUB domain containing protein 1a n=1 Tax=Sphaeramia orbicularis TaxID=375764 RepID=A0A672ZKR9_9TELE